MLMCILLQRVRLHFLKTQRTVIVFFNKRDPICSKLIICVYTIIGRISNIIDFG